MASIRINLTVDETAKDEAAKLFKAFGMDVSTAVNIYFKAVARTRKIPFEISAPEESSDIFSMNQNEFMNRVQSAVDNRGNISEPEYVVSMDLNEGTPYKLFKDNRKEYIDG